MKAYSVTLPIAVLFAGSGLVLAYRAHQKPKVDYGLTLGRPQHPVTPQMLMETSAKSNLRVPEVDRKDVYGKSVLIGAASAAKPQFVLFIKQGCPCSVDAQPYFNKLSQKYKNSVDFYGVMDASPALVKKYSTEMQVPFPVLDDADLKVIHGFGAKASVYSALVARNGHIVKMWPGYSDTMLQEINAAVAMAAGVSVTPFTPAYAPTTQTSGCTFL